MRRNKFHLLLLLVTCLVWSQVARAEIPEDASSPAIYSYFNISDDDDTSSLSVDSFNAQLEEMDVGNYTVLSLDDILKKEDAGETFLPNTLAITFDEPNADTYAIAIPKLVENKTPFTIFISPGNATDEEWDTLRKLRRNDFVTIGLTSFSYTHQGGWDDARLTEDLNKSKAIFREKMGIEPLYFSYPFGEYSGNFVELIRKNGFKAALGQNSGVLTQATDRMKIPRFTMTDDYGDIERFRTTSNAMPLPVKDIQPDISYMNEVPVIGFTVDDRIKDDDIKNMDCFSSSGAQPNMTILEKRRVELRFDSPPDTDRLRINCTITVPGEFEDDEPRYRWLGFLLYFPVKEEKTGQDVLPVQP